MMGKKNSPGLKARKAPEYVPVPGSEVKLAPGTRLVRPKGFTLMQVWLRSRAQRDELDAAFNRLARQPIGQRRYWSHGKLIERFGASQKDMDSVEEYAAQFKLCVKSRNPSMQMMELSGRRTDFSKAFKINWVKHHRHPGDPGDLPYRRRGPVSVPKYLGDVILRVRESNDPPLVSTRIRSRSSGKSQSAPHLPTKIPRNLTNAAWTGSLLARYYRFPEKINGKRLDGSGQTIALIELGEGYLPGDVEKFFDQLGTPAPKVVAASDDAGKNRWESGGGEVITDIDVVGAVAPGARLVVYFGERATAEELLNVVSMAVLDRERKPSVISISWGWSEQIVHAHHPYLIQAMGDLFKKAALLGITICVATGDYGSLDLNPQSEAGQVRPVQLHVDFPACLEASLACGGTWIARGREHVWNDGAGNATGGGFSCLVPRPVYQSKAHKKRYRGTPDVSAIAVHHAVIKQGKVMLYRGTSFVAPFWAGLIARLNQAAGKRMGFINPILYEHPSVCKSITVGHNDVLRDDAGSIYQAGEGWDPVTGLGVPNGFELLQVILAQTRVKPWISRRKTHPLTT